MEDRKETGSVTCSLLFAAEYWVLKNKHRGGLEDYEKYKSAVAISYVRTEKGFKDSPTTQEPWSHDNHTGLVCLSKICGFKEHKQLYPSLWRTMLHPRDLIFYSWAAGRWYSRIAWFFLWIPMIAMVVTCLQDYKVRNGQNILKTDGKILTWLRINSFNLPVTKWLCTLAIRNNKEFGSWKRCFSIYFKDRGHPNRSFPNWVYEK